MQTDVRHQRKCLHSLRRARKQTEFEKRKAAFAKLLGLLLSMMKRRALYDVLPLDPTAWPVLLAAHREELRATMAEQAATNKVDLSAMKAPGAQVTYPTGPMFCPKSLAMRQLLGSVADDSHAAHPGAPTGLKSKVIEPRKLL